ncbi:MAG TPA: MupA/Atu3671 family FMN-dependent luciferase-like monooxygenase, partial [Pyrinomonadaceae bacterium]|nr:MupA/Atu3671 family FMN-dependent luciferase-like monooxygenase [Pyrinomonadaceae bacterium]
MAEEVFAFPASFAQQRLWFLDQLEPGSILYNIPTTVRFQGPLDLAALERAFNEIIRRYEILRTTFSMIEQEPVQVVSPPATARLPLIDVSHLGASEQQTKVRQFANEEALQPFDLAQGPLMRVKLLKLGPEDHVLSVTMHHIISDGWSKGIFIREIKTLYEAYSKGLDSPLPELPIQYADFAIWQREWLQGSVIESMLAYWKPQLEGLGALDLPSDRPRPPVQTSKGSTYSFALPESLSASLNSLSRSQGVTLFMTLLAALQVLLSRYTGAEDIAVGTTIAGRNRAETEQMIGLFTNTLVLRTDLSGEPGFTKLLERVRKVCLDAYAHQDIPFEKLIMELQPTRDLSRSPLFQVMLILQNVPQETPQWSELSISAVETTGVVSRFDLSLSVTEAGGRLNGLVEYNTDLFDEQTVARMMDHYQFVLEAMVSDTEQNINEISLLSDADRQLILVDWNDTARDYPRDKCIHELFEAQVERTPESIAVVFGDQQLPYSELNRRANQLAHHLRDLGAGPDVTVGVSLERSLDTMVALLGVLKAGAAYVPLDPTYPADRLSLMVRDAGIELLLTDDKLTNLLVDAKTKIVSLRNDREIIARSSDRNPVHQTTADNLAYVIYTSGSTGQPKGVMVAHRNVINFFTAMDDRLSPQGVWLALTSISFDISVLELFWTLTRGYKVVIQTEQREIISKQTERRASDKGMQFSLFYFASDGNTADKKDKYRLLIEGAKFADQNDFVAVWTPERHFHAFGDLYPNPAVTGAAIATITERIQIRAGSVVSPLHHPIRVAEEWAMIDNLSHGRVGVSFASGWHAADFVFAPENYAQRRSIMTEHIDMVRKLWRGEKLPFRGGSGQDVEVGILPQPIQPELPVW